MDWKLIAGAGIAGVVAVSAVTGIPSTGPTPAVPGAVATGAPVEAGAARGRAVDALSGLLEREVEERIRLQEQVDALAARLAILEDQLDDAAPPGPAAADGARPAPDRGGARGAVSAAGFVAAGFSPEEAAYYQGIHDQVAVASLELTNQATREGWMGTPRFEEGMAAIRARLDGVRENMDPDTYARYLYALGRTNQVRVDRVLAGSAAEAAGMRPGDVLLSYGGDRLYGVRDLQRATLDGAPGQLVPVELLRDGRRLQAYVPRGALGVSALPERALPPGTGPGF